MTKTTAILRRAAPPIAEKVAPRRPVADSTGAIHKFLDKVPGEIRWWRCYQYVHRGAVDAMS